MYMSAMLGLASLTAASPTGIITTSRDAPTATPPTSKSQGFQLVVNVTNLSRDLSPSIHQKYIHSIHIGAGQSLLAIGDKDDRARVFYINGTALEFHFANSTVVSDAGTPYTPWGISLAKDQDPDSGSSTAYLNAGAGATGIGLTRWSVPYTFMYPETYAVCNESIPYYGVRRFMIVKQFDLGLRRPEAIPNNCVPVRLLAQCANGSYSSHEFAYETECYDDVAAIDWPKYRPW